KSLNDASTLCDIEAAINKKQEEEIRYYQLINIKGKYTTIGLPHISSQFFQDINSDMIDNNFVEDVDDEPQIILKAVLDDNIKIKFDNVLENLPVLIIISINDITPYEVDFTFESLRHIQSEVSLEENIAESNNNENNQSDGEILPLQ
ncbi:264_t:CDS:2, partial [Funneliformis geosporum]